MTIGQLIIVAIIALCILQQLRTGRAWGGKYSPDIWRVERPVYYWFLMMVWIVALVALLFLDGDE